MTQKKILLKKEIKHQLYNYKPEVIFLKFVYHLIQNY